MSAMIKNPPYEDIADALDFVDAQIEAAELHGLLSGYCCSGIELSDGDWCSSILGLSEAAPDDLVMQENQAVLCRLAQAVSTQLEDDNLTYQLLLPDDEQGLSFRLQALSQWCQGFLFGISHIGQAEIETLSAELKEVMSDLTEIVKIDTKILQETQTDEEDYTQLAEYVRMAVFMFRIEFSNNAKNTMPQTQTKLVH